ncbi:MAG: hypothetical protein HYV60_24675 [Planctomycetia bacterium]|nr:hypothetical protein [Planctomycetia bacterium]
MNVKESDAWKAAAWRYSAIRASQQTPFPGTRPPAPGEVIEELEDVLKGCPEFYPAAIEIVLRRQGAELADGSEAELIGRGLRLMLEFGAPERPEEESLNLIDNLEGLWRFDLCKLCLEILTDRFPEKAIYWDYLANANAQLGDVPAALRLSAKATEMEPRNGFIRANRGLFYLMAGDAKEAEVHLLEARRVDPENPEARGNLEVQRYLARHGGNFDDYLLRPVDREQLDHLDADGDFEGLDRLCGQYNNDRLQALGRKLSSDDESRVQCGGLIRTLQMFFDFVDRVSNMAGRLDEDVSHVDRYFEPIMHKFIYKFGDVDRQLMKEVFESLLTFYGFLSDRKLIAAEQLKEFRSTVRRNRTPLIKKMERYNAIRHDGTMDEDRKEEIRRELFADDHCWPHL